MHKTDLLFEKRKQEHIEFALLDKTEAREDNDIERVKLRHHALAELDFDDISISSNRLGKPVSKPFIVSSMTAGHQDAKKINRNLIEACHHCDWPMGVGSQRRELFDKNAHKEWLEIREQFPDVTLFGNIGISQLIEANVDEITMLVSNINASAMQVHLNPLQECIQVEGTPSFRGALNAITSLSQSLDVPVIVKETGCGFDKRTLSVLNNSGIAALDVSGYGGTHWGRIEGLRANSTRHQRAAETFKSWGISTVQSLLFAEQLSLSFELWGSGGVRNGLDAAKLIALGANSVGFAKPMLQAALNSSQAVIDLMETIEYELRVALFCSGCQNLEALKENAYVIT